ncbi:MAG: hypothetical protein EOO62_11165 [Hymenobacter sp.]|nr:MAG: hypothetical protein EOO62_11165 [Hymenobacter sp.]
MPTEGKWRKQWKIWWAMPKNKTNTLVFAAVLLAAASCGQHTDSQLVKEKVSVPQPVASSEKASNVALTFINAYVTNCNKEQGALRVTEWVNSSKLATAGFKAALKKTVDDAYAEDPELGLDADPLFDAQDYPDKGFELDSVADKANYVVVRGKGKEWADFKLTLKMVTAGTHWLVDGCGNINVPVAKRVAR